MSDSPPDNGAFDNSNVAREAWLAEQRQPDQVTVHVIRYREWWVRWLLGWCDSATGFLYEKLSERPYDELETYER